MIDCEFQFNKELVLELSINVIGSIYLLSPEPL